jgi:hypothetical protein
LPSGQARSQEQSQIIAAAIGKPKTKATAIVEVNAESKFIPRYTLSGSDMAPLHGWERQKPSPGQAGFSPHTRFQKGRGEWCSDMVNGRLMAQVSAGCMRRHSEGFALAGLSRAKNQRMVSRKWWCRKQDSNL